MSSFAQGSQESLYLRGLEAYLVETERAYSKLISDRDFQKVVVLKNDYIAVDVPEKIGRYEIKVVSEKELLARLTGSRKGSNEIIVADLRAMKNEHDLIVISVGEYVARLQEGRLVLSLSGGVRTSFSYDCTDRKFVVSETKLFGV